MRRCAFLAALACASSVAVPEARAQSAKDLASARQRFKEGEQAEKKGDCALAIEKFEAALAVKATPQLHLRIGRCREALGRLVEAMASYEQALDLAIGGSLAQVQAVAEDQISALRRRLPTLSFKEARAYEGLEVTLDGAAVPRAELAGLRRVDPGAHTIAARAPGYLPIESTFTIAEGEARRALLELSAVPAAPVAATLAPVHSHTSAYVVLGAGIAAAAAGGVLFAVAAGKDAEIDDLCGGAERAACPASQRSAIEGDVGRVNTLQALSFAVGGLGVAGIGVGAVLLLSSSGDERAGAAGALVLAPALGPSGAGVSARVRF